MALSAEQEKSIIDSFKVDFGCKKQPWIGIIYGGVKIGKSWLGRSAESPFYLPLESGALSVPGVNRLGRVITSVDETFLAMKCIANKDWVSKNVVDASGAPMPVKTIVIDSLSALQRMIWIQVMAENPKIRRNGEDVPVTSIADYDYGEGYAKALAVWQRFMRGVIMLRDKCGYNILLVCHSTYRNVNDENGTRKKLDLDLAVFGDTNTPQEVSKDADWVYLIKSEVCVKKMTANKQDKRMIGTQDPPLRVIYTRSTNLFLAGIRAEHEELIPDTYELDNTGESAKQLFKDLEQNNGV